VRQISDSEREYFFNMKDYIEQIHNDINRLLQGQMSLATFRQAFNFFYLELIPSEFLSDTEVSFFAEVDCVLEANDKKSIEQIRSLGQKYLAKNSS
jgi:hypothetical protein